MLHHQQMEQTKQAEGLEMMRPDLWVGVYVQKKGSLGQVTAKEKGRTTGDIVYTVHYQDGDIEHLSEVEVREHRAWTNPTSQEDRWRQWALEGIETSQNKQELEKWRQRALGNEEDTKRSVGHRTSKVQGLEPSRAGVGVMATIVGIAEGAGQVTARQGGQLMELGRTLARGVPVFFWLATAVIVTMAMATGWWWYTRTTRHHGEPTQQPHVWQQTLRDKQRDTQTQSQTSY